MDPPSFKRKVNLYDGEMKQASRYTLNSKTDVVQNPTGRLQCKEIV